MGSCSTGNNTWPSAWPNTAQLNATSPTTKSLFGSYLRRRRRIFSAVTILCLGFQLFQRGVGMRARGKNAQFSPFSSVRVMTKHWHLPFKNSNRLLHKARKLHHLKTNHRCSTVIFLFLFTELNGYIWTWFQHILWIPHSYLLFLMNMFPSKHIDSFPCLALSTNITLRSFTVCQ